MTHSLTPDGARHRLRIERRYPHPVRKVWRAITDPSELSGWFPARVETELAVGARMTFTFPGQPAETNGTITEFDPPTVFGFDWGEDSLRWELRADGPDATVLVFTHVFDDRPRAASFAAGWDGCFDALDQVLDGVAVTEAAPYPPRHESYVERFSLGRGWLEGTNVVFDRVYPWPREAVTDALRAQGPVEGEINWSTEDVPGGSRIRLLVKDPDDPDAVLEQWGRRLADVAAALSAR
ncbi:SRPBCC family protein [Labedaea rhizosphaerae]|uniref:Uncharacterized protein YndB with AHSA1/START domain n=1 Tax=Labedaea rhizosphaerae TaxID=598644 RepID=A0A4V3CXQ6_LABRH|nr:SRPBCC family protein [Labedaea rhizosphaerae]TDP91168.1 uncharacterized protein YndB with AHSA1/START domain [Labedaea rhizosphaerae]